MKIIFPTKDYINDSNRFNKSCDTWFITQKFGKTYKVLIYLTFYNFEYIRHSKCTIPKFGLNYGFSWSNWWFSIRLMPNDYIFKT